MGSELDFSSLEQEFNLNKSIENEIISYRDKLANIEEQGDSNKILRFNIERANYLLDLAEQEFQNGSFNARTLEACAKLLSEVTNAANSLKNLEIQSQTLDLKERTLDLKEFEIKNKQQKTAIEGGNNTYNNTNILLTDRENLLKMLREKNNDELLDTESIDI